MKTITYTTKINTPHDESRIAELIIDAIAEYMDAHELDIRYMSDIKLQKIVFKTVEYLNIPLTRSWYMRGCYIHIPEIINSNFLQERINNKQIKKEDGYDLIFKSISKNIEDIWWTPTDRLLKNLYNTQAPEAYRSIYIANNNILNLNKEINDISGKYHIGSTLARWIPWNTDYHQRAAENISRLHIELISRKEFGDVIVPFLEFTNVLEAIYLKLDNLLSSNTDISSDILEFLELVDDVYYRNIWHYPALAISRETVVGIRKDEIIQDNSARLEGADDKMNYHIEHLKTEASDLDLLPSIKDLETKYRESVGMLGEDASMKIAEFWKVHSMVGGSTD